MRLIGFCFLFTLLFSEASSQQLNSYVEHGMAYVNYTLNKAQAINAIAAEFNVSPVALMEANYLSQDSMLAEKSVLKIPLAGLLLSTCVIANCLPVYYEVQQGDGLYRIGKNHGVVGVSLLKQLNNLKTASVGAGTRLLVGFLQLEEKIEPVSKPVTTTAAANKESGSKLPPATVKTGTPGSETPVFVSSSGQPAVMQKQPNSLSPSYKGNGVYEKDFIDSNIEIKMLAAPFKSESGWSDGKFYVLINSIAAGTVVKIINPNTLAFVFAKVLGSLPKIKEKATTQLRINNAATGALDFAGEDHFEVIIRY